MKKIDQYVMDILGRMEVEGNVLKLTCGQLEPKEYKAVNAVLEAMGGKWNRKAKGHIFPDDAGEKLEMVLLTGEVVTPKDFGYFPTPPELAEIVVDLADLEPWHMVLEPEAEQGALAEAVSRIVPKENIQCVELLPENARVLAAKGYRVKVGDFLAMAPVPIYDRIVMNPPFAKQADLTHVEHAFRFLRPGGRLTAIMSAGMTFRKDRRSLAFRTLLEDCGGFEYNPEGSFKPSGTFVQTVRVILDKPQTSIAAFPVQREAMMPAPISPAAANPPAILSPAISAHSVQGEGLFPWYAFPAPAGEQEGAAA